MDLTTDRFVGDVNANLQCPICMCVLKDPVQDENEHTFCKSCIYKWMENHYTCPIDRAYLHRYKLKPATRLLKNFLSELEITCDYKSNGCNGIIKLDSLYAHLRECEYQPNKTIECPNGCEVVMQRGLLASHSCIKELKRENRELKESIELLKTNCKNLTETVKKIQDQQEQQQQQYEQQKNPFSNIFYKYFLTLLIVSLIYLEIRKYITNFDLYFITLLISTLYLYICYKTKTNVLFLFNFIFNKN